MLLKLITLNYEIIKTKHINFEHTFLLVLDILLFARCHCVVIKKCMYIVMYLKTLDEEFKPILKKNEENGEGKAKIFY